MRALLALLSLLAACYRYGQPVATAFTVSAPPEFEAAVRAEGDALNALLGERAFTFHQAADAHCDQTTLRQDYGWTSCFVDRGADPHADLVLRWSTEAEMAAHFPEVAKHGALLDSEQLTIWGPITDVSWMRSWVAIDYPPAHGHLDPQDVARAWLATVFWMRCPYTPSDDPHSMGYPHPTQWQTPEAFIDQCGGLGVTRDALDPKPRAVPAF